MIAAIILSISAPLSIFITLVILKAPALTFTVFFGVICLILPLIVLKFRHRMDGPAIRSFIGLKKIRQNLVSGVLVGLLFGGSIFLLFTVFKDQLMDMDEISAILDDWNIDRSFTAPLVFMLIIVNPLCEEIFWRGYVQNTIIQAGHKRTGLVFQALFYSSYHLITTGFLFSWSYGIILSIGVFFAGLFWGLWRQRAGSLYPAIISHLLADGGIMLVYIIWILPHLS